MNVRDDLTSRIEAGRLRRALLVELERPAMEARAFKLRVLHDIIAEKFDSTQVVFERHYTSALEEISSFAVFYRDKLTRTKVKKFVRAAFPELGLTIEYRGGDVTDIAIRKEKATEPERLAMLEQI